MDKYKSHGSAGSTGKNRTSNQVMTNRRSNPPPSSETGPTRRLLNFQPKRTGFGKHSSSGDSTKNRGYNQVHVAGARLGSSNKQHRSNSKEDKDKNVDASNRSGGKDPKFIGSKNLAQQSVLLGKAAVTNAKG